MSHDAIDQAILARQYADDRNLVARQRLWQISRSEPDFDFNRWSVDLLGVVPGDVVLDVGCGNGRPLAMLDERGRTAVGVDTSLGMLQTAGNSPRCAADVQALPFREGAFHAAAAFMMLYHVPDQQRAVRELRRVVGPGGVLVATTASQQNQVELRELVEGAVGAGWSWHRPSDVKFSLEGGADVLGGAFESVEVVKAPERRISITDVDALADYVGSTRDHYERGLPAGAAWDDVVDAVRSSASTAIRDHGAFVVTARLGAFVCR